MYDVFDSLLASETWHTGHPNDISRFSLALAMIVDVDGFDPDAMGAYMRNKVRNDALDAAIDDFVQRAWAVKEYLEAVR